MSKNANPIAVATEKLLEIQNACRAKIAREERRLKWLEDNGHKLIELAGKGIVPSVSSYFMDIDFDFLSHEEAVEVMLLFPAKWEKTPGRSGQGKIDYESEQGGHKIRLYEAAPPPNCKVVEVEEIVPAVPASTRKVKKLVCKEEVVA